MDVLTPRNGGIPAWDSIKSRIDKLPPQLASQLQLLYQEAEGSILEFRKSIEGWFNSSMERVSEWYKKRTRLVMAVYGLLVAIVFNVSAIGITVELYENEVVRDVVVSLAEKEAVAIKAVEDCADRECVEEKVAAVLDTGLPIWWRSCPVADTNDTTLCGFESPGRSASTILGWLVTAAALSMGASWWFAVLKRAFKLRKPMEPTGSA